MAFTSAVYIATGLFVIYGLFATSRAKSHARAESPPVNFHTLISFTASQSRLHSEPGPSGESGITRRWISEATISRNTSGPKVSQA